MIREDSVFKPCTFARALRLPLFTVAGMTLLALLGIAQSKPSAPDVDIERPGQPPMTLKQAVVSCEPRGSGEYRVSDCQSTPSLPLERVNEGIKLTDIQEATFEQAPAGLVAAIITRAGRKTKEAVKASKSAGVTFQYSLCGEDEVLGRQCVALGPDVRIRPVPLSK